MTTRRTLILGGLGLASALLLPSSLVDASNGDVTPAQVGSYCPSGIEWDFLNKLNTYRAQHGRGRLLMSRSLAAAAQHHAYYMSRTDDIDHSLGGVLWSQNIYNFGYPQGYAIGENVLAGRQSSSGALSLWASSPSHNANMLDARWTRVGVGRVYYSPNYYDFYWVTTFGSVSHRTISSC